MGVVAWLVALGAAGGALACSSETVAIVEVAADGGGGADGAALDARVGVELDAADGGAVVGDAAGADAQVDGGGDAAVGWCPNGLPLGVASSENGSNGCDAPMADSAAACAPCGGGFAFSCITSTPSEREAGTYPPWIPASSLPGCRTASVTLDANRILSVAITCCENPQCVFTPLRGTNQQETCRVDGGTANPVSCSLGADGGAVTSPPPEFFKNCFQYPGPQQYGETHCCN